MHWSLGPSARALSFFFFVPIVTLALRHHPFAGHVRYKRQLVEEPAQQIDLNITVPYIFSARLYPYGPTRGDISIRGDAEVYKLENPFHFMAGVYDTIYAGPSLPKVGSWNPAGVFSLKRCCCLVVSEFPKTSLRYHLSRAVGRVSGHRGFHSITYHPRAIDAAVPFCIMRLRQVRTYCDLCQNNGVKLFVERLKEGHGDLQTSASEPKPKVGVHYCLSEKSQIRRDGSIGMSSKASRPAALPVDEPTIAVFWMPSHGGNVHYRETDDVSIVNLAHNEVNIQYRYGSQFRVKSVVLVTWENVHDQQKLETEGNTFQLALIVGDSMTFAHLVYSKLAANRNAVAGFSSGTLSYSLPDSATAEAMMLSEKSDIGIPGEWLFRIDSEQVYLCGAGFKGLECIESCAPSQWFNDCSRSCHCDGADSCDQENGRCPNGKCSPGWQNEPVCDEDIDECVEGTSTCPREQPDCLNTPGAFLCLCFEYDEVRKACKSSVDREEIASPPSQPIPVDIVPLKPSFSRAAPTIKPPVQHTRFISTTRTTRLPPTRKPSTSISQHFTNTPLSTTDPTTKHMTTTTASTTVSVCQLCDSRAECVQGTCKCSQGWRGDGFRCYDVDECAVTASVCGNHSTCSNTDGGFECTCVGGFRSEDGDCVDVDECRETPQICGGGRGVECVNSEGSFLCRCRDGYLGDPSETCTDVNECESGDACGPNANCTNTDGGFECECQSGFERLAEGAHCTDRDECAVEPCHPAAICSNTRGGYSCACIEGFVGDGTTCHETILYPISNDSIVIPRSWNSIATLPLISPLRLFGRQYDTAFLSTNGVLSFDQPLPGLVENADAIHASAVFALHAQYDYVREGLVAYTYINETDAVAFPLLTRASLSVQQAFGISSFRTRSLHIFTFDRVRQAGSENLNSFQIVLSESSDATILTLIYELTQAKGPMTGISTPSTFYMLPNDRLHTKSNVGQPGKWMFRVDAVDLQTCPVGRKTEPFCDSECEPGRFGVGCRSECRCLNGEACDSVSGGCPKGVCAAGWTGVSCDEDVDECSTNVVSCGDGAFCKNTRGGYTCDCKKGYALVNKVCKPLERCLSRFGVPCARNARCIESENGPSCECRTGFKGDGFRCIAENREASLEDISKHMLDGSPDGTAHDAEVEAPVNSDRPFVMKNWESFKTSTSASSSVAVPKLYTVRTPPLLYTAPPLKPTDENTSNDRRSSEKVEEAEALRMLFWIVPSSLIGIWILIILVVCLLCWRSQRKRRERQQYNRGWKSGVPTSRAITAPVVANPNVIYSTRPRITYEGY
ncbi:unnamed protein product [Caenorhabditis auriculariae]|uniref:Uncharacterized protein n=1 Tax=Caenorhabditis auriculariae TaxID=2777116 RepID=A0A8S1GZX7_9PELO|nr:unnamed protein product [Caenorhabditis auriculariae]